jgi:hypothetical protein
MAKAPTSESDGDHMRSTVVCLTPGAQRYADKHQIRDQLSGLDLGVDCVQGDIVSLEAGDRPHDFIVLRRRWIIGSASRFLEITLDHPVRMARP